MNNNIHWNHNRPSWDRPYGNRPNWGWGGYGSGWRGNWAYYGVNPRYGWYNGPWAGYWGSGWYSPLAYGAAGWGLGLYTAGWGGGGVYYNPYYTNVVPTYAVYNYSQPIVVTTYAGDDNGGTQPLPQENSAFDNALALFRSGRYAEAQPLFDKAVQEMPGDAIAHEIRALNLFALGEYSAAAAVLNSLLSSAPGMDWTTMSGLYGNVADYTVQLRALEAFVKTHPTDAAAHFVLAYHYLVTGYKDQAVNMLKVVVANQPQDVTARRMLEALTSPEPTADNAAAGPDVPANPPLVAPLTTADPGPETDLVGKWRASATDVTIDLTISEDSKFTWVASPMGKPPVTVAGEMAFTSDFLSFDSADQGAMAGSVTSVSPDQWKFKLTGAPESDPGLVFNRVK